MIGRGVPTGLLVASLLLLGAATGCGDDSGSAADRSLAKTDAGTTTGAPATPAPDGAVRGSATVPSTSTRPGPTVPAPHAGPERGAALRSCGNIGSPSYRLRARGVACATARRVQRAWYPSVMRGEKPLGYTCAAGESAATDIPKSVRCRRGARLVDWALAPTARARDPLPPSDGTDGSESPSATSEPDAASVPQLARRCGNATAFDTVSSTGAGGCRAAKEIADAFETQYSQGGGERVTTLQTHVMDYRCVRTGRRFDPSFGYLRFDCTATRPADAPSAGVPTRVRFHEFGDV